MKILHTISGFGAKSGGTSTCTYDLISALHKINCETDIVTVLPQNTTDTLMGNGEKWIKTLPNDYISPYGYSRNIRNFIKNSTYDIYHTNGLWMYCNHITCKIARSKSKPYIITPHGMLYPEALYRSYWKKWPLIKLFFKKDILKADCIHATCTQEAETVRKFGYKGPVAVIPNPANLPGYIGDIIKSRNYSETRAFGFLGRLHPRKKVENILYAAARISNKENFKILIIGKGDDKYEAFLHEEVKRLNLNNVEFKGFVTGQKKFEILSNLSCLFVPSDFENFGMIVTEALSVGTPVMASLGTPWEELNTRQCGWWMERTPDNIASIMETIIGMSNTQLKAMGDNGIKLVNEKYTAINVAQQMETLYKWLINKEDKPDFIYE